MFKFTFTKYNVHRGFSMIEALVAITVLTLGVITPLSMLAKSLADANYARNQIVAFFLAQEGQELILNKRDNNILDGKFDPQRDEQEPNDGVGYWLGDLGKCIDDFCYIDPSSQSINDDTVFRCDDDVCPALKIDDNGFYGYSQSGRPSIFSRKIQIEPLPALTQDNGNERGAEVRVIVEWVDKSRSQSFTLKSFIYR